MESNCHGTRVLRAVQGYNSPDTCTSQLRPVQAIWVQTSKQGLSLIVAFNARVIGMPEKKDRSPVQKQNPNSVRVNPRFEPQLTTMKRTKNAMYVTRACETGQFTLR